MLCQVGGVGWSRVVGLESRIWQPGIEESGIESGMEECGIESGMEGCGRSPLSSCAPPLSSSSLHGFGPDAVSSSPAPPSAHSYRTSYVLPKLSTHTRTRIYTHTHVIGKSLYWLIIITVIITVRLYSFYKGILMGQWVLNIKTHLHLLRWGGRLNSSLGSNFKNSECLVPLCSLFCEIYSSLG